MMRLRMALGLAILSSVVSGCSLIQGAPAIAAPVVAVKPEKPELAPRASGGACVRSESGLVSSDKDKTGCSNLEACLKRAAERAKADGKARSTKLARVTAAPSDAREYQAFLVICEFKDGSVGIFQGGSEAEWDQWVVVEKEQAPLLLEAVGRVPTK